MCSGPNRSTDVPAKKKRAGSEAQFPGKLHDMMEYITDEGLEHVVAWVNDGTAFVVSDPDTLVEILPRFFSQTKYRSFQRQLNMWHFQRILDGPFRGGWKHPYFVQGKRSLCKYMSRHLEKMPGWAFVMKQQMEEESQQQQHSTQHQFQPQEFVRQVSCQSGANPNPSDSDMGISSFGASIAPSATNGSVLRLPYENAFQSRGTDDLIDTATLISQSPFEPTPIENMRPFQSFQADICHDDQMASFGGRNFHYVDDSTGQSSAAPFLRKQEQQQLEQPQFEPVLDVQNDTTTPLKMNACRGSSSEAVCDSSSIDSFSISNMFTAPLLDDLGSTDDKEHSNTFTDISAYEGTASQRQSSSLSGINGNTVSARDRPTVDKLAMLQKHFAVFFEREVSKRSSLKDQKDHLMRLLRAQSGNGA